MIGQNAAYGDILLLENWSVSSLNGTGGISAPYNDGVLYFAQTPVGSNQQIGTFDGDFTSKNGSWSNLSGNISCAFNGTYPYLTCALFTTGAVKYTNGGLIECVFYYGANVGFAQGGTNGVITQFETTSGFYRINAIGDYNGSYINITDSSNNTVFSPLPDNRHFYAIKVIRLKDHLIFYIGNSFTQLITPVYTTPTVPGSTNDNVLITLLNTGNYGAIELQNWAVYKVIGTSTGNTALLVKGPTVIDNPFTQTQALTVRGGLSLPGLNSATPSYVLGYDRTTGIVSYTTSSGGGGGGGGVGATILDELTDVVISSPAQGQVLKYDGVKWINDTDATDTSITLDELTDVVISSPAQGQILKYDGVKWMNDTDATISDSFVVATGTGTNSLAYSYDGLIWRGVTNSTSIFTTAYKVAWNGSIWLAAGTGTFSLAYSLDGINWTGVPGSTNTLTTCYDIAWNGSSWVAVGTGLYSTIASSPDGFYWLGRGKELFSTQGNGVAWNGSIWVAVGSGGNTVGYSYNGSNWLPAVTSIFTTAGNSVAWNRTRWVAVGSGGTTIAYSADGRTWESVSFVVFSPGAGTCVAWNGSRWVAVGK
jgi:hypothetical protein